MESSTGSAETNDDEGSNEHGIEMTNGDTAQIHGLTTGGGAHFNGTVCTVERKQGDRYIVKCNDGRLRAVPQTNLRKQKANSVDAGETGAAATPRISGSSGASPAVATREEQWQQQPQKQTQQQPQRKPHQLPQVQSRPVTSVAKPDNPTAIVRGTAEIRINGNAHLSPRHPGGTGSGNLHTVATKAKVAKLLPHKRNEQHRCKDGAHCYWLKKGVCRFYHPPEEVAAPGGSARVECQVRIPPNVVGYIIGRGGQCLQDMMDKSGAKIWIDQDSMGPHEMRIVYISGGSQKAIDMAAQLVKNAVTEIGRRVTSVTKPEIETARVRNTAEIRKTGNAHLSPGHPGGTGSGNFHTVATKAKVAKPLPHNRNEQHPCRDGAHCYWLKKGVCRFYHPPEEVAAAGGSARVYQLRIPPNVVGYVIGKGGQCLHDMMYKSGAKILIDQDSMGPHEMRIVYISGSQKAIDMAAEMVKNAVTEIGGCALMPADTSDEARPGVAVSPKTVLSVSPKESTSLAPVPPTVGSYLTTPVHQVPVVKPVTTSSVPHEIVQPTPPDHKLTASVDQKESGSLETISSIPVTVPKHARPHETLQPAPPEPKLESYACQNESGSGASVSLIPESAPALQAVNQTVAHSCPRETVQPFPPQAQFTPRIDPSRSGPIDSVSPMPNPMHISPLLRQTVTYSSPHETVQPVNLEPKLACQHLARGEDQRLLTFTEAHKNCIKGSPEAFFQWLLDSEDIASLSDLAEAVSDDEYLRDVLQPGNGIVGVKGFKRGAFKKAVVEAASCDSSSASSTEVRVEHREAGDGNGSIPTELVCPITHALMTNDPVLAADGFTYERYAIEAWFEKQHSLGRGVLSPITNVMMPNLTLIPNHAVRTMARDFSQASP